MRLYLNPGIRAKQFQTIRRSAATDRSGLPNVVIALRHASRLNDEDVAQLAESYRSGTSAKILAMQFGVHRHTVAEVVKRVGVERHSRGLTSAQVAKASGFYRDGWSLAKVAHDLGVTANTVRRYLLLAGVVMRSPNERHS